MCLNSISARLGPGTCLACSQKASRGKHRNARSATATSHGEARTASICSTRWGGKRLLKCHSVENKIKNKKTQTKPPKTSLKPKQTPRHSNTVHEETGRARGLSPRRSPGWLDGEAGDEKASRKAKAGCLRGISACCQLGKIISNLLFATNLRGGLNLKETERVPLSPHPSSPSAPPALGRSLGRGPPPALRWHQHQHGGVGCAPRLCH